MTFLLGSVTAFAGPPPDVENADPAQSKWYEGLQQPKTGMSCCSIADCRPTEYRIKDNHYEVYIDTKWLPVPPDKILHRYDNPTGRAIVCWTPALGIMCFVQGAGA